MNCNLQQKRAIQHGAGPMMVLAGPGSGKTFVLTQRIACLIREHHIEPSEILVITFTRAAAGEMQQRFLKLCSEDSPPQELPAGKHPPQLYQPNTHPPVTFGTFHAVFYAILKETSVCRTGSILSESEKKKILCQLIKKNQYTISTATDVLDELTAEIGRFQNSNAGDISAGKPRFIPQNIRPELFWDIYRDYKEAKEILGKVDFDDMAVKCEELFQKRPDILSTYQKRYRYLLIDEFQDIAPQQYRLMRMLAQPENNLFIVGDDDQSIYGFRGSKPDIMRNFPIDYPETEIVTLQMNYRSTPRIVEAASRLISHNINRFPKEIRAGNADGKPVRTESFSTNEMQEKKLILELSKEKKEGNLSKCAVICRTGNGFPILSEKLKQAGIPSVFREKVKSIFEHEIVYDLLAYLEFATTKKEKRSRAQFFRFMNRPLRYISREAVGEKADFTQMIRYYQGRPAMQETIHRLQSDIEKIQRMPVYLAIHYIRKAMGYDNYLLERYRKNMAGTGNIVENTNNTGNKMYGNRSTFDNTIEFQKRDNTESVLKLADLIQTSAKGCHTLRQWEAVIEERRQEHDGKPKQQEGKQQEGKQGVSLLTMHASKGLEYEKVYLIDCNEGITPHRRALTPEEIEEERRMFYVGMTRAKKELNLFYISDEESIEKDDMSKTMPPSRFLKELRLANDFHSNIHADSTVSKNL